MAAIGGAADIIDRQPEPIPRCGTHPAAAARYAAAVVAAGTAALAYASAIVVRLFFTKEHRFAWLAGR